VKGLKARGGVTVDIEWKNGKVSACKLSSPQPEPVKVRLNGEVRMITPDRN
jgi:alpha-L-fucosidase 2